MIQIERRALYNLLRMNWLMDGSIDVEDWQVEDYRSLAIDGLFNLLKTQGIDLDKKSFTAFADHFDTPEEMTDQFLGDVDISVKEQDRIYLVLFELWRRLEHERPCLSVFCDELDHQVYLYDSGQINDVEAIEDVLSNLQVVLDENTDEGLEPHQVFEMVSTGCANDIESFLYDFTSEQIDNQNVAYASELLDAFKVYVSDAKWFAFLRVRMVALSDSAKANHYIRQLLKKTSNDKDLVFNLEVLSFLVQGGAKDVFADLVKRSASLLEVEEDFQELLVLCADFYRCLDDDAKENIVQEILDKRASHELDDIVNLLDPHIAELLAIVG